MLNQPRWSTLIGPLEDGCSSVEDWDPKQQALIMEALPPLPGNYAAGLKLIDGAHSEDPRTVTTGPGGADMPYELHYASKMSRWLALRCPEGPSPALQLACRAQHFRR